MFTTQLLSTAEIQSLREMGYVVIESGIDPQLFCKPCEALCAWHGSNPDLGVHRYAHCPSFVEGGGVQPLVEAMLPIAEAVVGKDAAKIHVTQLLGSVGESAPFKNHTKAHVDAVANALDEAEERAKKYGMAIERVSIRYPHFHLLMGLYLTRGWLQVWPKSHLLYQGLTGSLHERLKTLAKMVEELEQCEEPELVRLEAGQLLLADSMLVHGAANPQRHLDAKYHVEGPNGGALSARFYIRVVKEQCFWPQL